jgi:hypothetical protein
LKIRNFINYLQKLEKKQIDRSKTTNTQPEAAAQPSPATSAAPAASATTATLRPAAAPLWKRQLGSNMELGIDWPAWRSDAISCYR